MSDTGLYSGLYSTVRKLAELVDTVILNIKVPQSSSASVDETKRLATILMSLNDRSQGDLTSNLLNIIVRDSGKAFNAQYIGTRLLEDGRDEETIEKLEILASILESERSQMLAKMRGQG